MISLANWKAQLFGGVGTRERLADWRRRSAHVTRIIVLLAWTTCFIVVLRSASIWNLKAKDNGAAARAQLESEIAQWKSQRTSSSGPVTIIARGSVQRAIFQQGAWLEATIDDPSKPEEDRLSICRFKLDDSGRIIEVAERSLPR